MKNTGITYSSAERVPVRLPEMAELLPPLSEEQLAALEADLLKNGCYSPVIVNEDRGKRWGRCHGNLAAEAQEIGFPVISFGTA